MCYTERIKDERRCDVRRIVMIWVTVLLLLTAATVGVQAREVQHETHTFRVGSEQETAYLVKEAAFNTAGIRFADARAEIVYRFDLKHTAFVQKIELSGVIFQQLHLLVSTDGQSYTEVYRWYGEVDDNGKGGLSQEYRSFDLTPFVDLSALDVLYVKIADSYTAGGWGGAIHPSEDVVLDVTYDVATEDELNAAEMTASEHKVPLFGCNTPWGGGFVTDTNERVAGYASLSIGFGASDVQATARLDAPVNGGGMDTLELDVYLSDRAMAGLAFDGALVISSAGQGDRSALVWDVRLLFSMMDDPVAGWNHVCLPLSMARTEGGAIALNAVNYVGIGWSGLASSMSRYTLKLDSICLTDRQAVERAGVIASMQTLLDTIDTLDAMTAQGLGAIDFRAFARLTEASRRAFDALTSAQRVVGMDFDLAARVARAEQTLKDYEAALLRAPEPEDDAMPAVEEPTVPPSEEPEVPTTPDEPAEPTEPPAQETRGTHLLIVVAVSLCVAGGVLATAFLTARAKKKC